MQSRQCHKCGKSPVKFTFRNPPASPPLSIEELADSDGKYIVIMFCKECGNEHLENLDKGIKQSAADFAGQFSLERDERAIKRSIKVLEESIAAATEEERP